MFKRLIIFGASRGLGRAVAVHSSMHLESLKEIHLVSRKESTLTEVADAIRQEGFKGLVKVIPLDLTLEDNQIKACGLLKDHDFDLVIYCAGGGPHGEFSKKEWKDHRWAMELNLLSPMRLVHQWLNQRLKATAEGKFIVVGSRIAENNPDPLAASYGSGKCGLYGLVNSLQPELDSLSSRVWLFSPGYIDTEMLPLTAKVRHDGSKLMSAEAAAQAMLRWVKKDEPWHRVLN